MKILFLLFGSISYNAAILFSLLNTMTWKTSGMWITCLLLKQSVFNYLLLALCWVVAIVGTVWLLKNIKESAGTWRAYIPFMLSYSVGLLANLCLLALFAKFNLIASIGIGLISLMLLVICVFPYCFQNVLSGEKQSEYATMMTELQSIRDKVAQYSTKHKHDFGVITAPTLTNNMNDDNYEYSDIPRVYSLIADVSQAMHNLDQSSNESNDNSILPDHNDDSKTQAVTDAVTALNTFLESHNFGNKNIGTGAGAV